MTRIIAVASGKGGVGKTTVVSNLAAALSHFRKSVVAIDANLTTSNLGLHLGIPLYPVTLNDVLNGRARVKDALYYHSAGFRVIPGDVSLTKLMVPQSNKLLDVFYKLAGDADFVLIDTAAGLGKEAQTTIKAADEMITVTNPEMPALTDALKLSKLANDFETDNLGVIVNRIKNMPHEVPVHRIEEFLRLPVIGRIYEDHNVGKSIANRQPVVLYKPNSISSQQIKAIAATLIGEQYVIRRPVTHRFFGWLRY
ncbi:MAG: cell division ATPase MinD [Candidatus Aenigmarchaeota archaeon]|nr:cell division ATPase MinD [Candidatus Aenigmarchaeota archaeon]